MDTIEYKAWDKRDQTMCCVSAITFIGDVTLVELGTQGSGGILGKDIILLQYTIFKDKNNHKLYESDLVKVPPHYNGDYFKEECVGIINYLEGEFYVMDNEGVYICSLFDLTENFKGEVIGNLYTHPQLFTNQQ